MIRSTLCGEFAPDTTISIFQSLKDAVKFLKTLKITEKQLKEIVEEELEVFYECDHSALLTFSWVENLQEKDDELSPDEDYPCKCLDIEVRHHPDVIAKQRLRVLGTKESEDN